MEQRIKRDATNRAELDSARRRAIESALLSHGLMKYGLDVETDFSARRVTAQMVVTKKKEDISEVKTGSVTRGRERRTGRLWAVGRRWTRSPKKTKPEFISESGFLRSSGDRI